MTLTGSGRDRGMAVQDSGSTFAALLRQLRLSAGLTQEELAEKAGVSPRSVSDWERGVNLTARKETARLLADALDLSGIARATFEAIARGRAQDASPGSPAGSLATPLASPFASPRGGVAAATRTLPRDVAGFTGRERELAQVLDFATTMTSGRDGAVGVFVIGGMAGVGKTAFTVHAAHRLAPQFPDGQIFLSLHGHTPGQRPVDPADALASLLMNAGYLAPQIPPDLEARASLWRDHLAGRKLLLLLDDAVGSDHVRPLLPGVPGSLVLISSRRHLTSLEDAQPISLDVLPAGEAAAMLTRLSARPQLDLGDGAVEEICRQSGYLPLALGMLARQLHHHSSWTAADLASELSATRHRLELMHTEDLSVAAAFDMSYRDLDGGQQLLFRRLGLHPGVDVDAWATAALLDADPRTARRHLDAIYDQHLIAEPARGRYRLHDLIREYAQTLAAEDPASDNDAAFARLTDYYRRTVGLSAAFFHESFGDTSAAGTRPDITDRASAAAWLENERANVIALTEELGTRDPAAALALAHDLSEFLRRQGHWSQALALHRSAAVLAEATANQAALADALVDLGEAERLTDQYQAAVSTLGRALDLYSHLEDPGGVALTLVSIGDTQRLAGDTQAATLALARALDLYRRLDDRPGQALALLHLGDAYLVHGEYRQATAALAEALELYRDLGDRVGQINTLNTLGYAREHLGDYVHAAEAFDQALELSRNIGNRLGEANALLCLGSVRDHLGEYGAAVAALTLALGIYREMGQRRSQANTLYCLGEVRLLTGEYDSAAAVLAEAIGLYQEVGDLRHRAHALNCLGALRWETAEYAEAERILSESLGVHREFDNRQGQAESLNYLSAVYQVTGRSDEARAASSQALSLYRELGNVEGQAHSLCRLGDAMLSLDVEAARGQYLAALSLLRPVNIPLEEARALEALGMSHLATNSDEANRYLRDALAVYERIGSPHASRVQAILDGMG
jgi:tetratricopeptide (TPR) repeat protein/DNA-binding XRE family transcriptional regulator